MAFGVGDSLSISISADTASFQAGAERVESQLGDLSSESLQTAAALEILSNRADDAGDNISQAGRRATVTSGQFSALSGATSAANTSFLGISATTWGSLIPAVVALTAALSPLIAAMGGFVAIGASIAGIGILGTIGAIATNTERLKDGFTDLVSTFQDAFAPAIEMATVVLEIFMEDLAAVASELAPTSDQLEHLGGIFASLSREVTQLLPGLLELAVTLTREFLPPLVEFVDDIGPQLPDIIDGFVDSFRNMIPGFREMVEILGEFLPQFNEFGATVLTVLGPALGVLFRGATRALRAVNNLSDSFSTLIAGGSLVLPILSVLASSLGGPITLAVVGLAAAVAGLARAFQTNFAGIRDFVTGLWNQIKRVFPAARQAINAFISGVDIASLKNDVDDLVDALGNQLDQTLEDLKPVFSDITTLLQDNKEEFRIIGDVVGDVTSAALGLGEAYLNVVVPIVRSILIPAIRGVIDILDAAIGKFATAIQFAGELREGDFEGAFPFALELANAPPEDEIAQQFGGGGGGGNQQEVRVVLDENTDLVNARVEQGARAAIEEQRRRLNRQTNSSQSP